MGAENVPQLFLQFYFMFGLGVVSNVVVISCASSMFNIVLAVMSTIVFRIMNRKQAETLFTLTVSASGSEPSLDPRIQCGRRSALEKKLCEVDVVGNKIEILSTKKSPSSCILSGVYVSEQEGGAGDAFSNFADRKKEIKQAVISEFKIPAQFQFDVAITKGDLVSTPNLQLASHPVGDDSDDCDDRVPLKSTISHTETSCSGEVKLQQA